MTAGSDSNSAPPAPSVSPRDPSALRDPAAALTDPAAALPELDRARVPELVLGVLRTLQGAGKQAFLAGGSVRDLARLALKQIAVPARLGAGERWPADFDVATDALPEQVMELFPRAIPTGIQHGTVTVMARARDAAGALEEHKVEVTTFRGEGPYLDGRRPSAVSFLGDIEGDLARRDFTINAMAWDPLAPGTSGLRDPFGGLADLRARTLRAVGDAHDRFAEDGLRPMRAVRFAATFRFALERATEAAIGETLDTFAKVAHERIRDELEKTLLRARPPRRGPRLLLRTGLLSRIAPALAEHAAAAPGEWRRTLRALDASPPDALIRFALFFAALGERAAMQLCDELRLPPKLRDRLGALLREATLPYHLDWTDGDCRRAMARITPPELPPLFAVRRALAAADGTPGRDDAMIERFEALLAQAPPLAIHQLALDGKGLMSSLGMPPGPQVGALLRLLGAVLIDPSLNNRETLLGLASDAALRESTSNPQG